MCGPPYSRILKSKIRMSPFLFSCALRKLSSFAVLLVCVCVVVVCCCYTSEAHEQSQDAVPELLCPALCHLLTNHDRISDSVAVVSAECFFCVYCIFEKILDLREHVRGASDTSKILFEPKITRDTTKISTWSAGRNIWRRMRMKRKLSLRSNIH